MKQNFRTVAPGAVFKSLGIYTFKGILECQPLQYLSFLSDLRDLLQTADTTTAIPKPQADTKAV